MPWRASGRCWASMYAHPIFASIGGPCTACMHMLANIVTSVTCRLVHAQHACTCLLMLAHACSCLLMLAHGVFSCVSITPACGHADCRLIVWHRGFHLHVTLVTMLSRCLDARLIVWHRGFHRRRRLLTLLLPHLCQLDSLLLRFAHVRVWHKCASIQLLQTIFHTRDVINTRQTYSIRLQ